MHGLKIRIQLLIKLGGNLFPRSSNTLKSTTKIVGQLPTHQGEPLIRCHLHSINHRALGQSLIIRRLPHSFLCSLAEKEGLHEDLVISDNSPGCFGGGTTLDHFGAGAGGRLPSELPRALLRRLWLGGLC